MEQRLFIQTAATPAAGPVLLTRKPVAHTTKLFDQRQSATLRRLCEALSGDTGTSASRILEFLNSSLSELPIKRKILYVTGLDTLEFQSQAIFHKPFARITQAQADSLLTPLRQPWVYVPSSTLVEFLRAAKQDVRSATLLA